MNELLVAKRYLTLRIYVILSSTKFIVFFKKHVIFIIVKNKAFMDGVFL